MPSAPMTKPIHTAEGAYCARSTGSSATMMVCPAVEPSVPAVRPYSRTARSLAPRLAPSLSGSFVLECIGPRKARQCAGPCVRIQASGDLAARRGRSGGAPPPFFGHALEALAQAPGQVQDGGGAGGRRRGPLQPGWKASLRLLTQDLEHALAVLVAVAARVEFVGQ